MGQKVPSLVKMIMKNPLMIAERYVPQVDK